MGCWSATRLVPFFVFLLKGDPDLSGEVALAHSAAGAKDTNLGAHHNVQWVRRFNVHSL